MQEFFLELDIKTLGILINFNSECLTYLSKFFHTIHDNYNDKIYYTIQAGEGPVKPYHFIKSFLGLPFDKLESFISESEKKIIDINTNYKIVDLETKTNYTDYRFGDFATMKSLAIKYIVSYFILIFIKNYLYKFIITII